MPFNQMSGLPMDLAVYGSGSGPQPFATRARLRPFPETRAPVPALGGRRHRDDARRHGARHHAAAARGAKMIPQLRELVDAERRGQHLLGPDQGHARKIFRRRSQAHQRASMRPRSQREVLPAYTRLADFLERDYLPAARTTRGLERPARRRGLVSLAHPRRDHHGHAAGRDPPARAAPRWRASAREMLAVKDQVGFKGDLDAFFKFLRERSAVLFHQREAAARRLPRREAPHRCAAAETVLGFSQGRLRDPPGRSRSARRRPPAVRTRRRRPTASVPASSTSTRTT